MEDAVAASVLHELRRLMPARPLRPSEAFLAAELQTNKLLRIHGIEGLIDDPSSRPQEM